MIDWKLFLKGFLYTVLASALIHLVILIVDSVITGNYYQLNIPQVIGLDVIFPGIEDQTAAALWLSGAYSVGVFLIFYIPMIVKKRKQKSKD